MLATLMRDVILAARAKTGAGATTFGWAAVAVLSAIAATTFAAMAAYSWLAREYDPVTAGLALAGFFAAAAGAAAIVCAVVRRRTAARAKAELAAQKSALLLDPRLLAVGFELARALGWRKVAPLALLGLLAAGLGRERNRGSQPAE